MKKKNEKLIKNSTTEPSSNSIENMRTLTDTGWDRNVGWFATKNFNQSFYKIFNRLHLLSYILIYIILKCKLGN